MPPETFVILTDESDTSLRLNISRMFSTLIFMNKIGEITETPNLVMSFYFNDLLKKSQSSAATNFFDIYTLTQQAEMTKK